MIDDEDDAAAERVFDALSESDSEMMEEAIAIYTVAGGNAAMLEAVSKKSFVMARLLSSANARARVA